jgi:hypothetical protein
MAHPLSTQRKLVMHSAHRTLGVSGGLAPGPYCHIESLATAVAAAAPTCVALAAHRMDADAWAAMTLFQQAAGRQSNFKCRCVDLDAADAHLESLADADCVVVFGQGLRIARNGSDLGEANSAVWTERCRRGKVFHTTMGSVDDFRQPEFVRLVLNTLAWIVR